MNSAGFKVSLVLAEIIFFTVPIAVVFLIFYLRDKTHMGLHLFLKSAIMAVSVIIFTTLTYNIGRWLGNSGLELWFAVSVSVFAATETVYWQLHHLAKRGNETAKRMLNL